MKEFWVILITATLGSLFFIGLAFALGYMLKLNNDDDFYPYALLTGMVSFGVIAVIGVSYMIIKFEKKLMKERTTK